MKRIIFLVAAANLMPTLAYSMSAVTLQCKLKIVTGDFVEVTPVQRSFDEEIEVRVKTYDKDAFAVELNGSEFKDHLVSAGEPGFTGSATPDEWRIERKSGDSKLETTTTFSISRRSGRLEYRKVALIEGRRASSAEANGQCAKNETTKRKF